MRKVLFIVNPASAGGRTLTRWSDVVAKIEAANTSFDVKFTKRRGCGVNFAKMAVISGGYEVIVSVGGDGTANEVVNGLMAFGLDLDALPLPSFTIFHLKQVQIA